MKTVRWKRLLIATDTGQLRRLTVRLDANKIRHAIGSHIPWKGAGTETWLMVPAADLSRAIAISGTDLRPSTSESMGDKVVEVRF
jgi:hypothetical protein